VVDDIGLLPVSEEAAEGLYRLVDAAYERRSVAVSSILYPSGFGAAMGADIRTRTPLDPLMLGPSTHWFIATPLNVGAREMHLLRS